MRVDETLAARLLPEVADRCWNGLALYLPVLFYTMVASQMGADSFSSWAMHMASIITFSALSGIGPLERKGMSALTEDLLTVGLALLIFSTVNLGYGNPLGASAVN
jgi:L-rhamnose-H+ transport protein